MRAIATGVNTYFKRALKNLSLFSYEGPLGGAPAQRSPEQEDQPCGGWDKCGYHTRVERNSLFQRPPIMITSPLMQNLYIPATIKTPRVSFDAARGEFIITGRSAAEDPHAFFLPLLNWLNGYAQNPRPHTLLTVKFNYFNTTSIKYMLELVRRLEVLLQSGNSVAVKWYYEKHDEEISELGIRLAELSALRFEILQERDEE